MSDSSQDGWVTRNPKKVLILLNVLFLVFIEFALRGLAFYGIVPIVIYPTSNPQTSFLGDLNEDFGVWHYPDREVRHQSPCFDVVYNSNSYGARDRERSLVSTASRRAVVIGDSFVEGYGVSAKNRMTDIAEEKTGVEFLNFGVSGNFGSIQQMQLYKTLASKFDHTDVFIYLLPDNDFEDNDPDNFPANRYRPYLRKNDTGNFEVYYSVNFEERAQPREMSTGRKFRRHFYNNFYIANLFRQLGEMINNTKLMESVEDAYDSRLTASYDNFDSIDLERLLYTYDEIVTLAKDKRVTVFIIPRELEFLKARQADSFRIVAELNSWASNYENVEVKDLLPVFLEYMELHEADHDDFFHRCDGHWSPLGNKMAALELSRAVLESF